MTEKNSQLLQNKQTEKEDNLSKTQQLLLKLQNVPTKKLQEIKLKLLSILPKKRLLENDNSRSLEDKNTTELESEIIAELDTIMNSGILEKVLEEKNISLDDYKNPDKNSVEKSQAILEIKQRKAEALKKTQIYKFFMNMESHPVDRETDIFKKEELEQLETIQDKLRSNEKISNQITDTLIQKQRYLMEKRGVDENTINIEIKHITDVVKLSRKLYPENYLLHFIAAAHDSMKRIRKNYTELGLHEFTSAIFGPQLIIETITEISKQNNNQNFIFEQSELKIIKKFSQRAIYSHGDFEWPEQNSELIDFQLKKFGISSLKNYWLYLQNIKLRADFRQERKIRKHSILDIIPQINALDMLVGANVSSFIKYINEAKPEYILEHFIETFTFLKEQALGSLSYNLDNPSLKLMIEDNNSESAKLISQYKKRVESFAEAVLKILTWNVAEFKPSHLIKYSNDFSELTQKLGVDSEEALEKLKKILYEADKITDFMVDMDSMETINEQITHASIEENKNRLIKLLVSLEELMNNGSKPLNILGI